MTSAPVPGAVRPPATATVVARPSATAPPASVPSSAQASPIWREDWRVECSLLYRLSLKTTMTAAAARANPALVPEVDDLVDKTCDDTVPLSEAYMARREFRGSTHWLRELGFHAPIVEAADAERYLAVIDIFDFLRDSADPDRPTPSLVDEYLHRAAGGGGSVIVHPNALYYRVGGDIILAPVLLWLGQAVEAHELFHGVQNATDPRRFNDTLSWRHDRWIWEGTARAVDNAWSLKPGTPKWRKLEWPRFDGPLDTLSYGASLFWLDVGRQVRATDWIGYLPELLSTVAAERGAFAGVDRALRELFAGRGGDPGGLYRAYPEFVRYALADPDQANRYFLPRPVELEIGPGATEDVDAVSDTIDRVATNAYLLDVTVPDGELAGLRIEVEPEDDRLHLIVDRARYDRSPPAGYPIPHRNTFTAAIPGTGAAQRYYVRLANVALEPANNDNLDVTVTFSLTHVPRCDPEEMMATIHPRARDAALRGGVAGLPGPLGTPVRVLMPADRYQAEHEPMPGLHPAPSWINISGLVSDRGVACAEPLGTNPLLGLQMTDASAREDARERLRSAMQRMMDPSSEEFLEALATVSPDSSFTVMEQLFPGLPGDRVRQPIGLMMESMGRDGDALLSLYSPHGMAWQLGASSHVGAGQNWTVVKHDGAGRWAPNAGAGLTVRLPGVSPAELKEDSTYSAELVTVQTSIGTPIYSRWSGTEFTVPCEGGEHPLLDGWIERVTAESLRGQVTIERFTGAAVEGSFSLTGTGRVEKDEYHRTSGGAGCPTTRFSGTKVRTGSLTVTGTFVAPVAVRTQRHGRAVALTHAVIRETEEDDGDIIPDPAYYPPGLDEEEPDSIPWPIPWPRDCVAGPVTETTVEDWHVALTERGERVERRTVERKREVLRPELLWGDPCPPPDTLTQERPIPDDDVDCRVGRLLPTGVVEDWHVVAIEGDERIEQRTVRYEWEVLTEPRGEGKPCPPGEERSEERRVRMPGPDDPQDCVVGDRIITGVVEDWHIVTTDEGERVEQRTVSYEWEVLVEPRNRGKPCPPGGTMTETRPTPAGVPRGDEPPGGTPDRPGTPRRPPGGGGGGDDAWLGPLWLAFDDALDTSDPDLRSASQQVTGLSPAEAAGIRVRGAAHRIRISLSPKDVVDCRIPAVLGAMLTSGQLLTTSVELSLSGARDSVELTLEERGGQGDLRFTAGGAAGGRVSVWWAAADRLRIAATGARFDLSGQDLDVTCDGVGDFVGTISRNP